MKNFINPEDQLHGIQEALGGKYTVQRRVGGGGMADVYLATNRSVGGKWAIKVLSPDIAREPKVVARFIAEARIGADIQHPNVIKVSDYGESGKYYYLIMPFIEGEDLGERMKRSSPLPINEAVAIAFQVTKALECAHEHRVVHRDLKPSNIRIDRYGTVMVLDFGIARVRDDVALAKTIIGDRLGTPLYMSPEQASGRSVDARSDLYSLGVLLYEMISGLNPFKSKDSISTGIAHITVIPAPLHELRPGVDPQISSIVQRLLQKSPNDRYQQASELRQALAPFAAGAEIRPVPSQEQQKASSRNLESLLPLGSVLQRIPETLPDRQLSANESAILALIDGNRSVQTIVDLSSLPENDAVNAIESLQRDLIYADIPLGASDVTVLGPPQAKSGDTIIGSKDLGSTLRDMFRPRKARIGAGAVALLVVILAIWGVAVAGDPPIRIEVRIDASPFATVVIRSEDGKFVHQDETPIATQLKPGKYTVEYTIGETKKIDKVTIGTESPVVLRADFLDPMKIDEMLEKYK